MEKLKLIFSKRCASKVRSVRSVRSDLKKLDSFTLETSKDHLIRNFLRNGRLRVNIVIKKLKLVKNVISLLLSEHEF